MVLKIATFDYAPYEKLATTEVVPLKDMKPTECEDWVRKKSLVAPVIIFIGKEGSDEEKAHETWCDYPIVSKMDCDELEKFHTSTFIAAEGAQSGYYEPRRMTTECFRGWDIRSDMEDDQENHPLRTIAEKPIALLQLAPYPSQSD